MFYMEIYVATIMPCHVEFKLKKIKIKQQKRYKLKKIVLSFEE